MVDGDDDEKAETEDRCRAELFRWFVGLRIDDPVWDVTVFTKNRDRLLGGEIATKFFGAVLDDARIEGLLSDEHFSVMAR